MNVFLEGTFKGLTSFRWNDVPRLAVITGINGTGKSTLLEAIAHAAPNAHSLVPPHGGFPRVIIPQPNTVHVSDVVISREEVLHLDTRRWSTQVDIHATHGIDEIHNTIRQLWTKFVAAREESHVGQRAKEKTLSIAKRINKPLHEITQTDFEKHISVYDIHPGSYKECKFGHLFYTYRVRQIEAASEAIVGQSPEDFELVNGPPPWALVTELLEEFNLPFRFTDPRDLHFHDRFKLEMLSTSGQTLTVNDLSSGESILFGIMVWVFYARYLKKQPKLLLLDEPDAFLHPSMARRVLDIFEDTLIARHNVQLIMATHSATTVSMVPDESLFVMSNKGERLKHTSRRDAIASLTAGIVIIHPGIRYVIVEDDDDVAFFDETMNYYHEAHGPSQPIKFISAGQNRHDQTTGGRNEVVKWVSKLREADLADLVFGLVDRDDKPLACNGISVLNRYSIENYLLDPIIVFAALLDPDDQKRLPKVPGVTLPIGNERTLLTYSADQLQLIADFVHSEVEKHLVSTVQEKERANVAMPNGNTLSYPRWLVEKRGKDLMRAYQTAFDSRIVNIKKLLKAYRKVHFVPDELLNTMATFHSIAPNQ